MNQVQVITLLNTLDTPSFYDHAPVGTSLPFIAIHSDQTDNFVADNGVYCEKWNFRIDLYSVEKSLDLEYSIKELLNNNGIAWQKSEQYLDDQSCWETEFDFEVVGDYVPPTPEPTPTPTPEPTPGNNEGGEDNG